MIVHVINLAQATQRWAWMEGQCRAHGLQIIRIDAADGARLSDAELAHHTVDRPGARPPSRSEIGCFESHKRAWRQIADSAESHGCVLEDDVCLAASFGVTVRWIATGFPDLDLVKLNAHRPGLIAAQRPIGVAAGATLIQPAQRTSDASAYLISRAHAARLLARHASFAEAVDLAIFDPASGARIGQIVPGLAIQAKWADFLFLDAEAARSSIRMMRADRRSEKHAGGSRASLASRIRREIQRVYRRRLMARSLRVTNLLRAPDTRLVFRQVPFAGR